MEKKNVAMAVLWLDGKLIMEERWIDTEDGGQDVKYAFPGGKVEEGESELQAMIREIKEETGIFLDPEDDGIKGPEELKGQPRKVYVFRKLLRSNVTVKDGIIICSTAELMDFKKRGKLMPFTQAYVEEEFIVSDGTIDN